MYTTSSIVLKRISSGLLCRDPLTALYNDSVHSLFAGLPKMNLKTLSLYVMLVPFFKPTFLFRFLIIKTILLFTSIGSIAVTKKNWLTLILKRSGAVCNKYLQRGAEIFVKKYPAALYAQQDS